MRRVRPQVEPISEDDLPYIHFLISKYGFLIRSIAGSHLKHSFPDSVEDAVQDTYEAVCRQVSDVRKAKNECAFICTIASRKAINEFNKRKALSIPLVEADFAEAIPYDPGLEHILPSSTSERDRVILTHFFHENATAVEIAEDTDQTDVAVRGEKKRAIDRLKKRLHLN